MTFIRVIQTVTKGATCSSGAVNIHACTHTQMGQYRSNLSSVFAQVLFSLKFKAWTKKVITQSIGEHHILTSWWVQMNVQGFFPRWETKMCVLYFIALHIRLTLSWVTDHLFLPCPWCGLKEYDWNSLSCTILLPAGVCQGKLTKKCAIT